MSIFHDESGDGPGIFKGIVLLTKHAIFPCDALYDDFFAIAHKHFGTGEPNAFQHILSEHKHFAPRGFGDGFDVTTDDERG